MLSYLRRFLAGLTFLVAFTASGTEFYVATDGADDSGDGSPNRPWASITRALDVVSSGDTVLVKAGIYSGQVRLRGIFNPPIVIRSAAPYQAILRNSDRVVTAYRGTRGILLEGFDIAHSGPGAGGLVVHIDGDGNGSASHITIRDNIIHDSYNNDLLKINNFSTNVLIERNMFYNQHGRDEHIDVNGSRSVIIQDNIFFNDFSGSGRVNTNSTSSFIVIKDSNGDKDGVRGARDVIVRRNVFLNWAGNTESSFVLVGEDGLSFYEAFDVTIENNLMLGTSSNTIGAPMGVKGGRDVVFRNNTIVGDLPALAYGLQLISEGANPKMTNIQFLNNVWSDPTGTMNRFSRAAPKDVSSFVLDHNLYWNGGNAIPADRGQVVNYTDDRNGRIGDPLLSDPNGTSPPRWVSAKGLFSDGSATVCDAFESLVRTFAGYAYGSPLVGAGESTRAPEEDILGRPRIGPTDIGAIQGAVGPTQDSDADGISDYCGLTR